MTMRSHLLPLLLGLVALALLLGAATAHAQPTPPASAPAATAAADPGFKPLAPGESAAPPDALSAPGLVKLAYSLMWVAVVGFLISLWRRHRRLNDEVEALRARVERAHRDG
jgi:hypothetical protein